VPRPRKVVETKKEVRKNNTDTPFSQRLQNEFTSKQSYLNLALGFLVVLVMAILVFNYFKNDEDNLLTGQQTNQEQTTATSDVNPGNLPGKYTVKEGDTLFTIAQKYYNDGYQYAKLVEDNKLASADTLEVGQVLNIPKLEDGNIANNQPAVNNDAKQAQASPEAMASAENDQGTGGATNQTAWGESITGDSYTVVEGDWLSTIAGRAYGDVMTYDRIAKANNIANPDVIEPGTVLKLPR
jgi:nucleoid-associated protein YgaU